MLFLTNKNYVNLHYAQVSHLKPRFILLLQEYIWIFFFCILIIYFHQITILLTAEVLLDLKPALPTVNQPSDSLIFGLLCLLQIIYLCWLLIHLLFQGTWIVLPYQQLLIWIFDNFILTLVSLFRCLRQVVLEISKWQQKQKLLKITIFQSNHRCTLDIMVSNLLRFEYEIVWRCFSTFRCLLWNFPNLDTALSILISPV